MHSLLVLALGIAAVAAVPAGPERIVGGHVTSIQQYPFCAVILNRLTNFRHSCGGVIINNRSILSAAHCFQTNPASNFQARLGSTQANSGGVVHTVNRVLNHPQYVRSTLDNDFSLLRTSHGIVMNNNVNAASIAGPNYNTGDNAVVWAVGWGALYWRGPGSPDLRHVQVWTVNQAICRQRYSRRRTITDNMLCAGWLDVGGRDACQGDSGGPLLHNRVCVGLSSFGHQCALPNYPGVNARVSRASNWIRNNA